MDIDRHEYDSIIESGIFVRQAFGSLDRSLKLGTTFPVYRDGKLIGKAALRTRHPEHNSGRIMLVYVMEPFERGAQTKPAGMENEAVAAIKAAAHAAIRKTAANAASNKKKAGERRKR